MWRIEGANDHKGVCCYSMPTQRCPKEQIQIFSIGKIIEIFFSYQLHDIRPSLPQGVRNFPQRLQGFGCSENYEIVPQQQLMGPVLQLRKTDYIIWGILRTLFYHYWFRVRNVWISNSFL